MAFEAATMAFEAASKFEATSKAFVAASLVFDVALGICVAVSDAIEEASFPFEAEVSSLLKPVTNARDWGYLFTSSTSI